MDKLSTKGQMVDQINLGNVPSSGFDLANHNFSTGKLGKIIPTRFDELYPGDRIKGRPHCVANFEPLVAPIMGSMVLKQESFFIPYSQVWKNAHNFFTAKKGFSDPMPSSSADGFYYAYQQNKLVLNSLFDGFDSLNEILSTDLLEATTGSYHWDVQDIEHDIILGYLPNYRLAVIAFGDTYGVRDLVTPVVNLIQSCIDKLKELINGVSYVDYTNVKTIFAPIDQLNIDVLNYWFGASSLFDYLSFPMPADFKDKFSKTDKFANVKLNATSEAAVKDYLANVSLDPELSLVPLNICNFRAYYLCWYWNYRDQLLELDAYDPESDEFLDDDVSYLQLVLISLLRVRCWFKDTFTTALTNTGSGNFIVPTNVSDVETEYKYYDNTGHLFDTTDAAAAFNAGATVAEIQVGDAYYRVPMNYLQGANQVLSSDYNTDDQYGLSLDLFERIKRLRNFTQRELILGYEYDDVVWSQFRVSVNNVRMHIPELLSRGRDAVDINTVVNNTTTTEQVAGDKTGIAYANGQASEMNYFVDEHGLYLQFMTILPIQCYANGMPRFYLKRERFDFAWPEFATMGMDAVYNCELINLSETDDESGLAVFGYQGRYYDLKSRQDEVHGRMRTDLNYMTFSRRFTPENMPKLNYIFVHCWPQTDMFVVDTEYDDIFKFDCSSGIAMERRLPVPSSYV